MDESHLETATEWCLKWLISLETTYSTVFPALTNIMEVCLSIPVSNAWPERGCSALEHLVHLIARLFLRHSKLWKRTPLPYSVLVVCSSRSQPLPHNIRDFKIRSLLTMDYFWTWEYKRSVDWGDYNKRARKSDSSFTLRSWLPGP